MKKGKINIRFMTELALLTAITLIMAYTPLGYLRVGPLNASFLTVPMGIGAILMGPGAGAVLGLVFGLTSFGNALTGGSAMGAALLMASPAGYFVVSVVGRVLAGFFCGLVFRAARKVDKRGVVSYAVGAVSAPLLNTLFYMGFIVLLFFGCDYVQGLVATTGAANPIAFVLALVGVQGLVEALICGAVGCIVSKAVDSAFTAKQKQAPAVSEAK
ncbi:MAG: ECF transporter S component [Eubacteriales bacterium]|nr:ECF transporter S component [Eubacteriales bacterium]